MEIQESRAASIPIPTSDPYEIEPNSIDSLPSSPVWPTIDGQLGPPEDDAFRYVQRYYWFGYALLPLLWAVNCFYFWPVLRHRRAFPTLRPYVVKSAIGFTIFTAALGSWAVTFAIGGESLLGDAWDDLVMYRVADRLGLTGWILW